MWQDYERHGQVSHYTAQQLHVACHYAATTRSQGVYHWSDGRQYEGDWYTL